MEFLASLFLFSGIISWSFIAVSAILLSVAINYNRTGVASFYLLALIGLTFYFGWAGIITYILDHPFWTTAYVVGFIAGSIITTIYKWRRYAIEKKNSYLKHKEAFLTTKKHQGNDIPSNLKNEFMQSISSLDLLPPRVSKHKSMLVTWAILWFIFAPLVYLRDPIKRFFTFLIYTVFGNFLQRISNKVYEDVKHDFS